MWHRLADERSLEIRRLEVLVEQLEVQLKVEKRILDDVNAAEARAFVRRAAIYIYTAGLSLESGGKMVGFTEKTAWEAAQALWDGKPEGC